MEETIEQIGLLRDRIENIGASINMVIPDKIHVSAMREILPELLDDANEILKKLEGKEDV